MIPVAIQPTIQVDQADCGIAALAMLLGQPYRLVSEAAIKRHRTAHKAGLWMADVRRIAAVFGKPAVKWRLPRTLDLDDVTGILCLRRRGSRDGHYVVGFQGVVVNPADGLVWDRATFLERGRWTVTHVLEWV